ncbi:MAG: hypothetical protein Kow0042_09170 [Calditrichia bacterium]
MAVKLRLRRMGRKKRPFYRIVAADSRSPRDGRFIEEIGYYNPLTDPATVEVKEDRALYWLSVGAIPSDTVRNLLSRKGIILRYDLQKRGLPEEKINEELKKWEVLQIERKRRLEEARAKKEAAVAPKPEEEEQKPEEVVEEKAEVSEASAAEETAEVEKEAVSQEAEPEKEQATPIESEETPEEESEKKDES